MKRSSMSRSNSRRNFSKHASGVQSLNLRAVPMRGGFRI